MMSQYTIAVTETLRQYVTVEADSESEAIEQVKKDYDNEEIVLDSQDHVDTEFESIDEDE